METELPFSLPYVRYADVVAWPAGGIWGPRRLYDHELFYVLTGSLLVELGPRTLEVGSDQVLLIPPRVKQRFFGTLFESTHIGVHFDWVPQADTAEFAQFRAAGQPPIETFFREPRTVPHWDPAVTPVLNLRGRPRVRELLMDVVRVQNAPAPYAHMQAGALLAAAIAALADDALLHADAAPDAQVGADAARRVQRARQLLERAEAPFLTVAEVAQRVGWGPDHLSRMFGVLLGQTPREVQIAARLNRAQLLLRYGTCTLDDAARRCGFHNPAHFRSAFKTKTGLTPRQFAQRCRSEAVD